MIAEALADRIRRLVKEQIAAAPRIRTGTVTAVELDGGIIVDGKRIPRLDGITVAEGDRVVIVAGPRPIVLGKLVP